MKGIIFNLVEEVVTSDYGIDTWEDLLDQSRVRGAYSAVGSYPDKELGALVTAASELTGISESDLLRYIGRRATPLLKARYEEFFALHADTRSFLGSLNEVIHPEVRKLYDGAEPPHFEFFDAEDGTLVMEYHSHRALCALAEGLIMGAGDIFGQDLDVRQTQCKLNGYPHCTLVVSLGE